MEAGADYRARISTKLFCSTHRLSDSYFKVYDALLSQSLYLSIQIEAPRSQHATPATTHEDVLTAAHILRKNPQLTLQEAEDELGSKLTGSRQEHQLRRTLFIAVRTMIMLDCHPEGPDSNSWQSDERYTDFMDRSFPRTTTSKDDDVQRLVDRNALKAWKLQTRFGVKFRGTDTLSRHLLLDTTHANGPTLYLFHHTSFLKAQQDCLAAKGIEKEADVPTCLERGLLAPRLVAEALHSFQDILFKFDDAKSQKLLKRLVKKGFDKDSALAEGYRIFDSRHDLEHYQYFGKRLAALDDYVQGRPPRNKFERWMKWQTSDSNAFTVALAALLISIVVGILTLGLSGFQAWVAWKAWKEPVSGEGEISVSLDDLLEWARRQREGAEGPGMFDFP